MLPYDSCYGGPCCNCVRCRIRREAREERTRTAEQAGAILAIIRWNRDRRGRRDPLGRPIDVPVQADPLRDALIDIAHDCGTLEAAQRRAKEALKDQPA